MTSMTKRLRLLVSLVVVGILLAGCSFLPWFTTDIAVAQTSSLSYPIVDTNQSMTYGNTSQISAPSAGAVFYGQDGQIDGNQMNYVDNGDGTVTDLVTGLMWQQGYSGKMSQSQAASGASSFSLAGYNDWRLPTIKELYSLIDFSGEDVSIESTSASNPFIDTGYFDFVYGNVSAGERIIDSQWATSTIYVSGGNQMFGVNFADGRIKGYGMSDPRGGSMQFYVRYVRGNTSYGQNDFVSNGDGTISDLATGLMWSQDDSGHGMDWEDALVYVQELNTQNYLGYSDWYLPNAKELQSIVDYSRSPDTTNSAAIDPIFDATSFTNEDGERDWAFYWTSTTHASDRGGQAAAYIAFGRGLGYMNGQYADVHGAGCQRSDPKYGSAIPTGRGPQGDTVRVDNYVRVVRVADGAATSNEPQATSTSNTSGEDNVDTSLGSSDSPNSNVLGTADQAEDTAYVLFAPLGGQTAHLIDRQGDLVNTWALAGRPGNSVYLLENGNLLATYTIQGTLQGGGIGGGVEELTWDGDEVWSFELATDHAHLHHDVSIMPNGNVLMISWETKTQQEALAAGLSANQLPESGEVWSEMILEYSPTLRQVVWEWHLWDHVLPEGQAASQYPEKIDLDYFANTQSEDWWHFNSIDYNANLDQIVVSSRAASEIWIIDHDLTTAHAAESQGDLLYRFGNPAAYGGSGEQVLVQQHDAEWIANGLPGEGNLLVFDNGNPRTRPYSRVVEFDLPFYGASSSTRVLPAEIVWQYPSEQDASREVLFADHISGAQRLESGNTLICNGIEGRFFEVTSDGAVVWEYVNPFTSTTPDGKTSNSVFRCEQYLASSPELQGQDLGLSVPTSNLATSPDTSLATQPNSQATGQPPSGTSSPPQGIREVDPSVLSAGVSNQMVTIQMDPRLIPPAQVSFTSVAIGDMQATSWIRSGNTIQAWFDIPAQTSPGEHQLIATFPGREGTPIAFYYTIGIQ